MSGGSSPPGIQKAFKKEAVFDGIHMGDPQGIGDDGGGGASPAAGSPGLSGDIGHHQKIMGEVFLPDDLHLVLHPFFDGRGNLPVPPPASLQGGPVERLIGLPVGHLLRNRER